MDVGKRPDASFDCLFQTVGCVGLRKHDSCLYGRKQVLASVLCFPSQRSNLLLTSLLLGNIPCDLRCSNDLALGVFNGRNGQ